MLRATGFAPILLGVLLAHALHRPDGFRAFRRVLGHRVTPLVVLAVLLACLELLPDERRGWPKLVIYLLLTALIGSTVVREDHVLARLLAWRPIARIGVVSYGIYLLHLPVQNLLDLVAPGRALPDAVRVVLIGAGTIAAAELSYRFFETPFLTLKKRFAR